MKKPLSYATYFKGNKKVSTMYILTLIIAILILGITKIILASTDNEMSVTIHQSEIITELHIINYSDENSMHDNMGIINRIKAIDSVESILPAKEVNLPFRYFIGASNQCNYFMKKDDAVKLLNALGVNYSKKDLPEEEEKKAFISERAVKNAGLDIGDKINKNIDATIDKTFVSDFIISVIPTQIPDYSDEYIIIPKSGKLSQMNSEIKNIINSNFELVDNKKVKDDIGMMQKSANDTFFIVLIIISFACSITTGITTYIHYYNRRKEIGIMKAIGYSDKKVVARITKEVTVSTSIALIIAIVLIVTAINILNVCIAQTNGFVPFEFDFGLFSNIIIIPVFMGMFSLVPTWIMLQTIDKMTLIQRGY
jgi:putative ABC transport system permease protein